MQNRLCLSLFFLLARHGATANIDQITVFFCVFFVLSSYVEVQFPKETLSVSQGTGDKISRVRGARPRRR